MKIPNTADGTPQVEVSLARIVSEDSQRAHPIGYALGKSSKDS